jgi:hypothetical protein
MRFKKILRSPTSTNHSLNARSPLGNDERSFAVRGRTRGSQYRSGETSSKRTSGPQSNGVVPDWSSNGSPIIPSLYRIT